MYRVFQLRGLPVGYNLAVQVYATRKQPVPWADDNDIVAYDQFYGWEWRTYRLDWDDLRYGRIIKRNKNIRQTPEGGYAITCGSHVYTVDSLGALTSIRCGNYEYLAGPLEPDFWKPANDNQRRNDYEKL